MVVELRILITLGKKMYVFGDRRYQVWRYILKGIEGKVFILKSVISE